MRGSRMATSASATSMRPLKTGVRQRAADADVDLGLAVGRERRRKRREDPQIGGAAQLEIERCLSVGATPRRAGQRQRAAAGVEATRLRAVTRPPAISNTDGRTCATLTPASVKSASSSDERAGDALERGARDARVERRRHAPVDAGERRRAQPRRERRFAQADDAKLGEAGLSGRQQRAPTVARFEHPARNRGGALDAAVLPLAGELRHVERRRRRTSRRARDRGSAGSAAPRQAAACELERCRRSIDAAGRLPRRCSPGRSPSSSVGTPNGRPIRSRSPSSPVNVLSHRAVSMPPSPSRPEASSRPLPDREIEAVDRQAAAVPRQPRRRRETDRHARRRRPGCPAG